MHERYQEAHTARPESPVVPICRTDDLLIIFHKNFGHQTEQSEKHYRRQDQEVCVEAHESLSLELKKEARPHPLTHLLIYYNFAEGAAH